MNHGKILKTGKFKTITKLKDIILKIELKKPKGRNSINMES